MRQCLDQMFALGTVGMRHDDEIVIVVVGLGQAVAASIAALAAPVAAHENQCTKDVRRHRRLHGRRDQTLIALDA